MMHTEGKRFFVALFLMFAIIFGWDFFKQSQEKRAPAHHHVREDRSDNIAPPVVSAHKPQGLQDPKYSFGKKSDASSCMLREDVVVVRADRFSKGQMSVAIDKRGMVMHSLQLWDPMGHNIDNYGQPYGQKIVGSDMRTNDEKKPSITIKFYDVRGHLLTPQDAVWVYEGSHPQDSDSLVHNFSWVSPEGGHFSVSISTNELFGFEVNGTSDTEGAIMQLEAYYPLRVRSLSGDQRESTVFARHGDRNVIGNSGEEYEGRWMTVGTDFFMHCFGGYGSLSTAYTKDDKGHYLSIRASSRQASDLKGVRFSVLRKDIFLLSEYDEMFKDISYSKDYGWLAVLARPLDYVFSFLCNHIGSAMVALIVLTFLSKICLFPLTRKGFVNMQKMRVVGPKMAEIKELYKDNKVAMHQAMMDMYRKEGVNPLKSVGLMFLQLPIIFALYPVLSSSFSLYGQSFWWVKDLSGMDTCYVLSGCGLSHVSLPDFLRIGIWPFIMGMFMWAQQKFAPMTPGGDKQQETMMMYFLPAVMIFAMKSLAVGVLVYWSFNTLFSIIEQRIILQWCKKNI